MSARRPLTRLAAAALLVGLAGAGQPLAHVRGDEPADPWAGLPAILARIQAPTFPDRDFVITKFGARADGTTDASAALRSAIAACHKAGGGRVVVPAGDFATGPVTLLGNVNLHLEKGATLRFSNDPRRYLPVVLTRWEGLDVNNWSPFPHQRARPPICPWRMPKLWRPWSKLWGSATSVWSRRSLPSPRTV